MLEDRLRELGGASPWHTESLRLTAFPGPSTRLDDAEWWQALIGQPPEARVSRPRLAGYQEGGPFERGRLMLTVSPTRIDWNFTPADPGPDNDPGDFLHIGSLSEALPPFVRVMSRWLTLGPDLQRVAFGAVVLFPVPDAASGYRHLRRLLPTVDIDAEQSTDLFYQINRPRPSRSGIANLQINRLSKWSAALLQRVLLNVSPGGIQQIMQETTTVTAARLELDMNTAPSLVGNLPRERLPEILEELVELAVEVVLRGDIP